MSQISQSRNRNIFVKMIDLDNVLFFIIRNTQLFSNNLKF